MSIVSLVNVSVLNNPAKFTDPYEFEITFECLEPLKDDLEWKLTYVGSSTSFEHDQELDSLLVGPVPVGTNKFVFSADPPSPDLIPASELVSVTVILLSCSYSGREFVRVGYYVNNEYDSDELNLNPPPKLQIEHVVRSILAEKPRVTRFNIAWDSATAEEFPPEQPEADLADDDEDEYAEEDDEEEQVDNENGDTTAVDNAEGGAEDDAADAADAVDAVDAVDAEDDAEEDEDEDEDLEDEDDEEDDDEEDEVEVEDEENQSEKENPEPSK